MSNSTEPDNSYWNSQPAWKLPGWCEPVMVASILFIAMYTTRRRDFSILSRPGTGKSGLLDGTTSTAEYLLLDDSDSDRETEISTTSPYPHDRLLQRHTSVAAPPSRFHNNIHSRVLSKFPFLLEMFYWIINYAFYRLAALLSNKLAGKERWDVAQAHGIAVLDFEHSGCLSFLFPVREQSVQQWFMQNHGTALTVLNKCYALIHIPGTVGFLAYAYTTFPSPATFATTRRTLILTNLLAFLTFICYPCAPPRLLPARFHFFDTVRHDDATSVFMQGKFMNQLAAMPSMHFGYAAVIGLALVWQAARCGNPGARGLPRSRSRPCTQAVLLCAGVAYPLFILVTIVATANHYFLDALVAALFVGLAFAANRVFCVLRPLEDCLLQVLRVERPRSTTGSRASTGRMRR
ncbi:hypothetical protein ACN47E_006848 [Coniothyrium glycines]